jgi:hypothetical protein
MGCAREERLRFWISPSSGEPAVAREVSFGNHIRRYIANSLRYLWLGYSDDASNHQILLLALMINVKRRENLPSWGELLYIVETRPVLTTK